MPKRKPPYVQLGLLSLLLIVAPLGSYLYLKFGYNYRLESLSELQDFGAAASFVDYRTSNTDATVDVVYVAPLAATDSVATAIAGLHSAFDKQPLVQFAAVSESPAVWGLTDAEQSTLTISDRETMQRLEKASSGDPHCASVPLRQRALIVDTGGVIRRCYDLHRGQEVNRIVEQINILLPRPPKEDMIFEQKREY